MPDPWKPHPLGVYRDWCSYILNHGKDVTPWEQFFTKDMAKQVALDKGFISQRQAEILERIYSEKT